MKKVSQRYGWYVGNVVQPRDQIADRSGRLQAEKVVHPNKTQILTAPDGRKYEVHPTKGFRRWIKETEQ
jgi:hypothetical protein